LPVGEKISGLSGRLYVRRISQSLEIQWPIGSNFRTGNLSKGYFIFCFVVMIHESHNSSGNDPVRKDHKSADPSIASEKTGAARLVFLNCPVCERSFEKSETRAMPFCSSRCRQIDLGRWMTESYGLPYEAEDRPQFDSFLDDEPE
jgi:endogenous inhibitor of DNA gyrase (YacG/DUF329 family)